MPYVVDIVQDSLFCFRWDEQGEPLADQLQAVDLFYGSDSVLHDVISAAESAQALVVVDLDYYDLDIRSEVRFLVQRLYSGLTLESPRLHFFTDVDVSDFDAQSLLDLDGPLSEARYRGYTVLRLRGFPTMGRTMIDPEFFGVSPEAVRCGVAEWVNFFGVDYRVAGFPFMQQDTLLTSCFHANLWMVAYGFTLRGLLPRTTAGMIGASLGELGESLSAPADTSTFPNEAITMQSAVEAARRYGLVAKRSSIDTESVSPARIEEMEAHLNSGFPLSLTYRNGSALSDALTTVNGSVTHSVVVCGFDREAGKGVVEAIIVHDDQTGLYRRVPVSLLSAKSARLISDESELRAYLKHHGWNDNWPNQLDEPLTFDVTLFGPQGVWVASSAIPAIAKNSATLIERGFAEIEAQSEADLATIAGVRGEESELSGDDLDSLWDLFERTTPDDDAFGGSDEIGDLLDVLVVDLESKRADSAGFRAELARSFVSTGDDVKLRYYVALGSAFKSRFLEQNLMLARDIRRHMAGLSLPKFVWVVEAMDYGAWSSEQLEPCVLAEVVFDASSPSSDAPPLWIRSGGFSYRGTTRNYVSAAGALGAPLVYSSRTRVVGADGVGLVPPHKSATRDGF